MLDYPESKDWYVAEVSQVLHDRFTLNDFITIDAPGWLSSSVEESESGCSQRDCFPQDMVQG